MMAKSARYARRQGVISWDRFEPGTALFEALNAKRMSAEEIAETFIVPAQYEQLVSVDHSYLVGPRGSGKTTLLRMLQGQTLMLWKGEKAASYRRRVPYSSIFVPADQLWASQAEAAPGNKSSYRTNLGVAAFGTQLLVALVESLQYRLNYFGQYEHVHLGADLRHRDEVDLVDECARVWNLDVVSPSLNGLANALDRRMSDIADRLADPTAVSGEPFVVSEPIHSLRTGIRLINRMTRQPDHRWALLLDEMELAPRSIHKTLVGSLRGGDPHLIFKLSFSPFDHYLSTIEDRVNAPSPDNDFRPIYLWSGRRMVRRSADWRFASGIWRSLTREMLGSVKPPQAILGTSNLDAGGSTWRLEDYSSSSSKMRLISRMADADADLRAFFDRHGVDLGNVEELSYSKRSSTLRKVYPLLAFRDEILIFSDGRPVRHRTGNSQPSRLYSGEDAVFAALEGNPRWMKAVFSRLISQYDGRNALESGVQHDALLEAAERFENLLEMLPLDGVEGLSVAALVNTVADNLHARLSGRFSADPATMFRVDHRVSGVVHGVLRAALSAGAIIHVRDAKSPVVLADLRGERFRLAYLLCVRDGRELPMRLGKTIDLSALLQGSPFVSPARSTGKGRDTLF